MKTVNNIQQLLNDFANQSDELFDLGIIRTDSFTGEIGEYVASEVFNFRKTDRVTRAVDGIDPSGKRYQVKAKVIDTGKINYSIGNLDIEAIDYLVLVYFTPTYDIKRILQINSNQLPKGKVSISNKFLKSISFMAIEESDIKLSSFKQKKSKNLESYITHCKRKE